MDMAAKFQDQNGLSHDGKRAGWFYGALTAGFARPARGLPRHDQLRYDYPVVLLAGDDGAQYVQSLSSVIGD